MLQALTSDLPSPSCLLSFDSAPRLPASAWNIPPEVAKDKRRADEHVVTVRDSELLTGARPARAAPVSGARARAWSHRAAAGVLDKSQLGASQFGLIHCVYELFGPRRAADLLTGFSHLLTACLLRTAVSCGIDDLTLMEGCEVGRRRMLDLCEVRGKAAVAKFVGAPPLPQATTAEEMEAWSERIRGELRRRMTSTSLAMAEGSMSQSAALDAAVKAVVHDMHSNILDSCLPDGQTKPFPRNFFALMILTGAKGTKINHAMVSCALGQMELEGARVPRMVSGRTLPCFAPYDPSPRAGGYIGDRFLTGLRPQDYYFHCMAGREGLVDTAVKTSRSGYLQVRVCACGRWSPCVTRAVPCGRARAAAVPRKAPGGPARALRPHRAERRGRCRPVPLR